MLRRLRVVALIGFIGAAVAPASAQPGSYLWDIYLAQDAIFLKRVERAIVQSAVNIRAEGSTNSTCVVTLTPTQCHAQRSQLAGHVLAYPETWARNLAVGFVTQPGIAGTAACTFGANGAVTSCTTTATDATLQTVSDSLWNDYSVP